MRYSKCKRWMRKTIIITHRALENSNRAGEFLVSTILKLDLDTHKSYVWSRQYLSFGLPLRWDLWTFHCASWIAWQVRDHGMYHFGLSCNDFQLAWSYVSYGEIHGIPLLTMVSCISSIDACIMLDEYFFFGWFKRHSKCPMMIMT